VAAGGSEHRAPWDIPGVGRLAAVSDPQGAVFMLMKPQEGMARPEIDPASMGLVGWHELMAIDGAAAFDFYADLFGWTRSSVYDMGPMGAYQLFATSGAERGGPEGHGPDVGGIMTKPPSVPMPFWTYYFRVDGINAAVARILEAGGVIANGPHQVPSDDWIVQGFDPQGAMFALLSAKE
jgi:predicted enzyme related to lactoylglutathione lyase